MEAESNENSQQPAMSSNEVDHQHENIVPEVMNRGVEHKPEFADEEVRGVLETIASTGKFWHDWEKLKSMLSFQLKQVLSEYPEAKMTAEQQNGSLGETYDELVKRLDGVLVSFIEGPPFTLQRLCEILLAAQSIYPNLSKLALALDKNLLVTSMLTRSTGSHPQATTQNPDEPEKISEESQLLPNSVENGVEPTVVEDRDEIMIDADATDFDDGLAIEIHTFVEYESSERDSMPP